MIGQNAYNFSLEFTVLIRCMTFNHSKYIENALNSFVIQETSFPFVCLVVDDYSTDGEQDVIKAFLNRECEMEKAEYYDNDNTEIIVVPHQKNVNCTFAVYFLKENHYSKRKRKFAYVDPWHEKCKYEALCEGDDYWIDPLKLQKQVEFMESHPDCTMTCSRAKLYSEKQQKYIGESFCYKKDCDVKVKDVIYRQGLFISTPSIVYRIDIKKNYPVYCYKCAVGDYPLQIYAAMQGKVRYFNDAMVVYRTENSHSWMGKQGWHSASDSRLAIMRSTVDMLNGFANDYPQYKILFENKIADFINRGIPYKTTSKEGMKKYFSFFSNEINKYKLLWKIDKAIRLFITKSTGLRLFYQKHIMSKYNPHTMSY